MLIIATSKIAVTLDNCSEKWHIYHKEMSKMDKMLHNEG